MHRLTIPLLGKDPEAPFPALHRALDDPAGLLAFGGDLSVVRLLNAYRRGIFPWYGPDQPILWWSPDPRVVFDTADFMLPSRFRRQVRKLDWTLRADQHFNEVIGACASVPRRGEHGTWITPAMIDAYCSLHRLGHAHSVEVIADGELIGGIYGVAVGQMFFGESMFSLRPGASKLALAGLARLLSGWGWPLIDGQVENPHLMSLGARRLARSSFMRQVDDLVALQGRCGSWSSDLPDMPVETLATIPR